MACRVEAAEDAGPGRVEDVYPSGRWMGDGGLAGTRTSTISQRRRRAVELGLDE